MPLKRKFLTFILVIVASRAVAAELFTPIYSAQGSVKFQIVETNNAISYEQTWLFDIMEDSVGRWKLDIHTRYPDPKLPITTSEIISYDNTNIYCVVYSNNRVETPRNGSPRVVQGTNRYPAGISAGPYPIDQSSAVGVVWLAFLGPEYLPQTEKKINFPNLSVPSARTDPMAWSCDFEFDLVQEGNHPLLKSGQYPTKSVLPT